MVRASGALRLSAKGQCEAKQDPRYVKWYVPVNQHHAGFPKRQPDTKMKAPLITINLRVCLILPQHSTHSCIEQSN